MPPAAKREPVAPEEPSFEAAMTQLEALVVRLEDGELELESALAAFEEGVQLTRRCAELLAAAERRIEALGSNGETRPFDTPDDESPSAVTKTEEG